MVRVKTYADPLLDPLSSSYAPITIVSPSIETLCRIVIRSAVVRGQLGNLRPVGGEVAGRVAREHVRGPAVGSLVVVCHTPRSPPCRHRSRR